MRLEFKIKLEDIKKIRAIISKEYSLIGNTVGYLVEKFRKLKNKKKIKELKKLNKLENNIVIEFDDEKITYNNTIWEKAHELAWKDLSKVFCKDGYIFLSGEGIKCFYLCNEDYFSTQKEREEFISFLNEKIGTDIIAQEIKKKRVITYKKEYKNQDAYISNLVDEKKIEKTSYVLIFFIGIVLLSAPCILSTNETIRQFAVISAIISVIIIVIFSITGSSDKRDLRIKFQDREEEFERNIILDKDKNCIIIEDAVETVKFNIADYIGTTGQALVFRVNEKVKIFNVLNILKASDEEKVLLSYLKENKYDNAKNAKVYKNFKRKINLQTGLGIAIILTVIVSMIMLFVSL
ncbi:MAG: hypothetical protein ACRC6T_11910 [Sarcina sp.]